MKNADKKSGELRTFDEIIEIVSACLLAFQSLESSKSFELINGPESVDHLNRNCLVN